MTSTAFNPASPKPVLGFMLLGGPLSGALVRDIRLANECARRGYQVHVWWMMDKTKSAPLSPEIHQHWLFHGLRYWGSHFRGGTEFIGRCLHACFTDKIRAHTVQTHPRIQRRVMENVMHCICDGVEKDNAVVRRFARQLNKSGVTHLLPMLEMLCPWIPAVRPLVDHSLQYLVTFQGYELYSTYARSIDREQDLYKRLVQTVYESDWPAIAVSQDYAERVTEEVGVPADKLVAIPPGVPAATKMEVSKARGLIRSRFGPYRPDLPLITYLGRRDTEKGIDLLLYAVSILRHRGLQFQLAICGPTLWGNHYSLVCEQIAEELRLGDSVMWRRFVPDDVRSALFSASHCVVYPSIHREPFGMVAAECVAHGTPAIVPDYGGVASAIEANGEVAGLRFKVWNSGDLADQIERLLKDQPLHQKLSEAGPRVAEYFSIEHLADRVLAHVGLK